MTMVTYHASCKVCNHPAKDEIEKMILARTSYSDIVSEMNRRFPQEIAADELSRKNVSDHKTKHLIPARTKAMEELVKESGIEIYSSISLLTDLITEWRDTYDKVRKSTDFKDPRQKNALATAQRLGMNIIKLNMEVLGDDSEGGDVDLTDMSKMRKEMERVKAAEAKKKALDDAEEKTSVIDLEHPPSP